MNDLSVKLLVFGIFFFMGIIFGAVALIINSVQNKLKLRCTMSISAAVVELARVAHSYNGSGGRRAATYAPVYEYEFQGKNFRRRSNFSSSSPSCNVGDIVQIFIDPNDPEKLYNPNESASKVLLIVFGALGVLFILISFLALIFIH